MQGLQILVANQSGHLREPCRRMATQQIDDAFAVGPAAYRSESSKDREICLARAELLDARATGDQRAIRRSDLGQEGIGESGLSDSRVSRDEDHLAPPMKSGFEDLAQDIHLSATPNQVGRDRKRFYVLRLVGRGFLRLDLEEKAIAAPDDGLDGALTEHAPKLTQVRTEKTLAHRDLPPHRLHDLLLSQETERICRQESKDRKRLATELQ